MLSLPGRPEAVTTAFAVKLRIAAAHIVIEDRKRAEEEASGG